MFDSFVVKSSDAKECDDEINFKSYQRVVTLKKRHGKCGSYHHDDGSFFIGDFDENGVRSVRNRILVTSFEQYCVNR